METSKEFMKKGTEILIEKMYMDVIHDRGIEIPDEPVKIFSVSDINTQALSWREILIKLLFTENAKNYDRENIKIEPPKSGSDLFFIWIYFKIYGCDEKILEGKINLIYFLDPVMKYLMNGYKNEDLTIDVKFNDDFSNNSIVYPIINNEYQEGMNIFIFLDKYKNIGVKVFKIILDKLHELEKKFFLEDYKHYKKILEELNRKD